MSARASLPAANQPALIKMTRTEAYQRIRSAAAQEFANERSSQIAQRAEFERHYGSTVELDQSFVSDLRALMLRASAIAISSGNSKTAYDKTVVPNKVLEKLASSIAGAVGECELYLSNRKARSMFAAPDEADFLGQGYGSGKSVTDPSTWVGDRARHVVDQVLAGIEIVDDQKISSVFELEREAAKLCQHDLKDGHPEDDEMGEVDPKDEETGGMWKVCRLRCGYSVQELTLHGQSILVSREDMDSMDLDLTSICRDGVIRLPEGIDLAAYKKLPKKKRADLSAKIGEILDAEELNERAAQA